MDETSSTTLLILKQSITGREMSTKKACLHRLKPALPFSPCPEGQTNAISGDLSGVSQSMSESHGGGCEHTLENVNRMDAMRRLREVGTRSVDTISGRLWTTGPNAAGRLSEGCGNASVGSGNTEAAGDCI